MKLFELFGTIAIDDGGAVQKLNDVDGAGQKAESGFSKVAKGAAVVATAVTTAAVGAVALGKAVLSAYADYEQLVGGVDTLFKDSSKLVQSYAENAYKTAGMSANQYMETVTGFSASLIQSLGGDTEKAAKYADMAITDMSDNANKMGSDITSIQTAYQGFSKQNYTMLDNLKLGYGGTKEEMQRLLDDAEKLSGIEYDISSYADIVDAIHVVQDEMEITGTTAKEASSTITGSINTMKGAFTNLIAGMGNPSADVEKLANDLVDSFLSVVTNITPVIDRLVTVVPVVAEALLKAFIELLPSLLTTAMGLVQQIMSTFLGVDLSGVFPLLSDLIMTLIPMALSVLGEILPLFATLLESLLPIGIELLNMLLPPILQIVEAIMPIFIELLNLLMPLIEPLLQILDPILKILMLFLDPLLQLIDLILPPLIELFVILTELTLKSLGDALSNVAKILSGAFKGAFDAITGIIDGVKKAFNGISDFVSGIFSTNWKDVWKGIKKTFSDVWESFTAIAKGPINGIIKLINGMITQINKFKISVPQWLTDLSGIKSFGFNISKLSYLKSGLDYVPYDNYPAMLHQGEKVLTKEEAKREQAGQTIVININGNSAQSGRELLELIETAVKQQRFAGGIPNAI